MSTLKIERYQVVTDWDDGTVSKETRENRPQAEQLAERYRSTIGVTSVTVKQITVDPARGRMSLDAFHQPARFAA